MPQPFDDTSILSLLVSVRARLVSVRARFSCPYGHAFIFKKS